MTGTTNATMVGGVINSAGGGGGLPAGTYDIKPEWNGKTLALWTSVGSYTFNLTRATSDALPLGFEVTIVKVSTGNTITFNFGGDDGTVQMYTVKDNKMLKNGTFTMVKGTVCMCLKLKKIGGGDSSWIADSNVSFS